MMKKRLLDLVNREIDGATTPEEHAKLGTLMDSDPDIARLYADLRRLSEVITPPEAVDPPRSLKHAIMRQVEAPSTRDAHASDSRRILGIFQPSRGVRSGLIFAAGVAAGLILFVGVESVLKTPTANEIDLTGTIGSPTVAPTMTEVSRSEFSGENIHGVLTLSRGEDLSILALNFHKGEGVRAEVSFDPKGLKVDGVQSEGGIFSKVHLNDGQIEITCTAPGRFGTFFKPSTGQEGAVRVKVFDARGSVMFDRTLPLATGSAR